MSRELKYRKCAVVALMAVQLLFILVLVFVSYRIHRLHEGMKDFGVDLTGAWMDPDTEVIDRFRAL